MDQHITRYGERWPVAWLHTCGLPEQAGALNRLYEETSVP